MTPRSPSGDRLAGRIALVTGGGRGIGAATVRRFLADGAAVVALDRDAEPLDELAATLGRPPALRTVVGDASVHAEVAVAIEAAAELGSLDIVVCNAGSTSDAAFHAMDDTAWRRPLDDVLEATRVTLSAAVPVLRDAAGAELAADGAVTHIRKITTTGAAAAQLGSPGQANLAAAGAGVVALTRTLARELGGFGICVNALVVGFVSTRLTTTLDAGSTVGVAEPLRQMTKAMTALGRFGSPDDVAAVHAFLASSDADFITGAAIPVTGGLLGTR